jgi:hypothetical protein
MILYDTTPILDELLSSELEKINNVYFRLLNRDQITAGTRFWILDFGFEPIPMVNLKSAIPTLVSN